MSKFPSVLILAIAFVLGVAVTAGAAKLITGKDIKDGSIEAKDLSKKARATLKGQRGARGQTGLTGIAGAAGPQGPKGDAGAKGEGGGAGAPGTNGTPGANGVAGPAIIAGTMSASDGWSTPGTGSNFGAEDNALVPVPEGSSYTGRNFSATVPAPPGAGKTITITLRINQTDSSFACSITGASATTCTPPAGTTQVVPAGSLLSMRTDVATAGATATTIGYSYRAEF